MITGLFEIHITVDYSDGGFYNLFNYVSKNDGMKLILAVAKEGDHRDQYMISKFKNGTEQEVIDRALQIKEEMIKENIEVLRIKVESMAFNEKVPVTDEDYKEFIKVERIGKPYFEFHAKIKTENIQKLEEIIISLREILKRWKENETCKSTFMALSFNLCGSKIPLLTIRVYNNGRHTSIRIKDFILEYLKKQDYHIVDAIQQEFSVYDTNDSLDKGWLI